MKKLLEIRLYTFENITILVKLDRRTKKLSFVEWNKDVEQYLDKDWLFAGRELSYMNSWIGILHAMENVIKDCTKVMESWDKDELEKTIKLFSRTDGADSESESNG